MASMTAAQLAHVQRILDGPNGFEVVDKLIKTGFLSDLAKGNWNEKNRLDYKLMGDILSIHDLIELPGTVTSCLGFLAKAESEGYIWRSETSLHLHLNICKIGKGGDACMCSFARNTDQFERLISDLMTHYHASHLVLHSIRSVNHSSVVSFEPGHPSQQICDLPGAFCGDGPCGTHPVINGINMTWQFSGAKEAEQKILYLSPLTRIIIRGGLLNPNRMQEYLCKVAKRTYQLRVARKELGSLSTVEFPDEYDTAFESARREIDKILSPRLVD